MTNASRNFSLRHRMARLTIGVAILGGVFALVVGIPHPGGEVGAFLDQTEAMDVQATALFYADLEQYSDIESRLWGEDGYRELAKREQTGQGEASTSDTKE